MGGDLRNKQVLVASLRTHVMCCWWIYLEHQQLASVEDEQVESQANMWTQRKLMSLQFSFNSRRFKSKSGWFNLKLDNFAIVQLNSVLSKKIWERHSSRVRGSSINYEANLIVIEVETENRSWTNYRRGSRKIANYGELITLSSTQLTPIICFALFCERFSHAT